MKLTIQFWGIHCWPIPVQLSNHTLIVHLFPDSRGSTMLCIGAVKPLESRGSAPMTMEQSTAGLSVPVKAPVLHWWVYYDCAHWERMQKTNSGDSKTTGCWVYSSHSANRWDRTSSRSSLPDKNAIRGPKHLKQCLSRINYLPGSFFLFGGAKERN